MRMAVTVQNNRNLLFPVSHLSNATGTLVEEDDIFIVQLHNVPRHCTAECIVKFFQSSENGESTDVLLGTDGVLLQSCYTRMIAYALFYKEGADLAMKKNGKSINNEPIHINLTNIYEVMFQGFALRRSHDDLEKSGEVLLKDMPPSTTLANVMEILYPYCCYWVEKIEVECITESPNIDIKCMFTSETAAFFAFMKKNRSIVDINGTVKQIRIYLHSCYLYADMDHTFAITTDPMELVLDNVTHEMPNERSWSIVTLSNLPSEITVSDLTTVFSPKVMVAEDDITLFRETPTTKRALIYFEDQGEAVTAIGNIACFTLGEYLVSVHVRRVTEHWGYRRSIFNPRDAPQ